VRDLPSVEFEAGGCLRSFRPVNTDDLARIARALEQAAEALRPFVSGSVAHVLKERGDPLTEADLAVNEVLRATLPRAGEAWLSEESADDDHRLAHGRVWVVDPIDGTQEFVQGIPEWCVSIGLVEHGVAVAGGIHNPATGETVLGAVGQGVRLNGAPARVTNPPGLDRAVVLASRSEVRRGEWDRFADAPFVVRPCGSVAYKLALVAAGLADATWTLVPKSEWDVAAGAALVRAGGGRVLHADGSEPRFNRADPRLPDFLAGGAGLLEDVRGRWLTS
jgi:myo-inositol-1(or 4)-monophosphatase